jgi:hypothetical protein
MGKRSPNMCSNKGEKRIPTVSDDPDDAVKRMQLTDHVSSSSQAAIWT